MNPLDPLIALESPLLDGLAPELKDLRDRAHAAAVRLDNPKGCSSCVKKQVTRALADVAKDLELRMVANPALAQVFPTLLTSAKQVSNG
jgi:hypothetical protein